MKKISCRSLRQVFSIRGCLPLSVPSPAFPLSKFAERTGKKATKSLQIGIDFLAESGIIYMLALRRFEC